MLQLVIFKLKVKEPGKMKIYPFVYELGKYLQLQSFKIKFRKIVLHAFIQVVSLFVALIHT